MRNRRHNRDTNKYYFGFHFRFGCHGVSEKYNNSKQRISGISLKRTTTLVLNHIEFNEIRQFVLPKVLRATLPI